MRNLSPAAIQQYANFPIVLPSPIGAYQGPGIQGDITVSANATMGGLIQCQNFLLNNGAILTAASDRPLIIQCTTSFTIANGKVVADGNVTQFNQPIIQYIQGGACGGAGGGGGGGGNNGGTPGGAGQAGQLSSESQFTGIGFTAGASSAAGGAGAGATNSTPAGAGTNGTAPGQAARLSAWTDMLAAYPLFAPLCMGGAPGCVGGQGGNGGDGAGATNHGVAGAPGQPGNGGGCVIISAPTITFTLPAPGVFISANGTDGTDGAHGGDGTPGSGTGSGGGSGGSGGGASGSGGYILLLYGTINLPSGATPIEYLQANPGNPGRGGLAGSGAVGGTGNGARGGNGAPGSTGAQGFVAALRAYGLTGPVSPGP